MTVIPSDILTVAPRPDQIQTGVTYAIKSIPHTYDRMVKQTWKRAARTARGKVNEAIVLEVLQQKGLQLETIEKSYRDFDASDYTLNKPGQSWATDLKTFHILNQFVVPPRQPLSLPTLCSSTNHTGSWYQFYPMLVPADYRKPKELFIFAISAEARSTYAQKSILPYPWRAFPEADNELFLCENHSVQQRERTGNTLSVTLSWPNTLQGRGSIIYERNAHPYEHGIDLSTQTIHSQETISSLISIGLNDTAYQTLRSLRESITIQVSSQNTLLLSTNFTANRFQEIFPRSGYQMHFIGWITRQDFKSRATILPAGTPCYFYPPREREGQIIEPGTKTENYYILPQSLYPIEKLLEL